MIEVVPEEAHSEVPCEAALLGSADAEDEEPDAELVPDDIPWL